MGNSLRKAFIFAISVYLWGVSAGQSPGQTVRYVSTTGGNIFPYTDWSKAATTIGTAVSVSSSGDTIWVADGLYVLISPVSISSGITVSGTNSACGAVVDGNNSVRCFELNHAQAVISNLKIQNGYAIDYAGGVDLLQGTVTNCTIVSNRVVAASMANGGGGVCVGQRGLLTHSRVLSNSVTGSLDTVGGGVSVYGLVSEYGRVYDTEIRGNRAYSGNNNGQGGGIFIYQYGHGESLQIINNISQGAGGGAMLQEGGMLKGSQITSNEAVILGGGIALYLEGGQITDCDVVGNTAGQMGGGLDFTQGGSASGVYCVSNNALKGGGANFSSGGSASNCTFVYNSATTGGGIYANTNGLVLGQAILHACIINFNQPENYLFQWEFSQLLEYCLTKPSNACFNGAGNVIGDPILLTDGTGRLQAGSLGIDQGGSIGVPRRENPSQDYPADGNFDGTALFDIGAFEFSNLRDSDLTGMPDGWLYRYFGQIHGIVPTEDADKDGLSNLGEFIAGTHPTNPVSVFKITTNAVDVTGTNFVLSWWSVSNRLYDLSQSTNLVTQQFSVLVSNIAATPPVNVYTGAISTNMAMFYRIDVKKP